MISSVSRQKNVILVKCHSQRDLKRRSQWGYILFDVKVRFQNFKVTRICPYETPTFMSKAIETGIILSTDYGHPERALFQKSQTFGLGQTNWAYIFWGIWGIFGQTISAILALWVPCPWENVLGCFSYKKLWFSGLKHNSQIWYWL